MTDIVAGEGVYADPVLEQELFDFAVSSLPEWYAEDALTNEFLRLAAKVMAPSYTMARDWLSKQSLILEADEATATTPDWLAQHARDRGTYRQEGEAGAQLRARLREIPDAVTRPALLAAVNAVLAAIDGAVKKTATKTWEFATTTEDIVQGFANNGAAGAFLPSDGDPAGCFQFTFSNVDPTTAVVKAVSGSFVRLNSWEEWGVPPGATVTHVRCEGYRRRLDSISGAIGVEHSFAVQLLGEDNTPLCGGGSEGYVEQVSRLTTTAQGAWEPVSVMGEGVPGFLSTGHGGNGDYQTDGWPVRANAQASNAAVFMKLWWNINTTAGAAVDWRLDELQLTITYQLALNSLRAGMVELPRDEAFLGSWTSQAGVGGTFADVGDGKLTFTPTPGSPYPYGFKGLPFDPRPGRWRFRLALSGSAFAGNDGTFPITAISGDGAVYENNGGHVGADPGVSWTVLRVHPRREVLVDGHPRVYLSRGFRVGSMRPTIILILPYPTTEATRLVIAELVRNLKAGGVISRVERREIP